MAAPNWQNQTIWTGDCLDIMRGMNSESVDLLYLDPPFNSNADYSAPIGSKAAGAAFTDTWGLDDINLAWHGEIKAEYPGLYDLLQATRTIHSDSMMSYLIYMAIRIMEMRRLLKDTGSLYLHCDPTASHYLKLLLDCIFGTEQFRNEIVWKRRYGNFSTVHQSKKFGACMDTILFYSKSEETQFIPQYSFADPSYQAYIKKTFRHVDEQGRRYRIADLANPATRPNLMYEYKGYPPPKKGWAISREKMEQWETEGRLHFPKTKQGRIQRRRFYDELKGKPVQSLWADIDMIGSRSQERQGYPTQKPVALLKRIIQTSSNPGDMILDPFCGCATACIAAASENRQWVGIDISSKAADLVQSRMREELGLFFQGTHRTTPPTRTDLGKVIRYNDLRNKKYLYGEQGGYCNGCETHFEMRHLQVDHIIARSKGGTDHISNLQLLCGSCNTIKGTKSQEELIVALTDKGYIKRKMAA